ncbi:phage portal protein [Fusobacterium gastrosuis]|uniref:phage portal protein n=1 Tax=Fusobacterium gastrosuis TaxID=1755100 RepID=UPI0029767736|nr:phage portal protein [Fusobacteriaceae bacterium]MDY5713833.1 phage portal protein [Fusobacterium gastrosuis]
MEIRKLEYLISAWLTSKVRLDQLNGQRYYEGNQDILKKQRTIIDSDGRLTPVDNLVNSKILDNQYAKMVDQKVNYLLAKKPTFNAESNDVKELFESAKFLKLLRNLGEDSFNCGIAWVYPYFDKTGKLQVRKFNSSEILPIWRDNNKEELEMAIRFYSAMEFERDQLKTKKKVEIYSSNGVDFFNWENGRLKENGHQDYVSFGENKYNWEKVPLIAFRSNNLEQPLICRVKCLQDALNEILSKFQDNMMEDAGTTILILTNYDGENLGEFRRNLATYRAVKVSNMDGGKGGLDKLTIEVNAENYELIIRLLKKAIIENARGFDSKDDRLGGNPNEMNIQSMYSDVDLDANQMEVEFQASFEELMWFINVAFRTNEKLEVVFNRDVLVNEAETIVNCNQSSTLLSLETVLSQHPWVSNVDEELKKIKKQKQESIEGEYVGVINTPDDNE